MTEPLAGVRILELGQIIAGTYGGQVLSDLGAEVIKIESPEGDLGRNPSVAPYRGVSGLFLTFNRNKKSVVIDLKNREGLDVFYELVRQCDVVVDNFRAGVLERLKIDYATLRERNPRIIQCSVTGFGIEGEYKDYPALDIIVQAMSGHMAITGEAGRPPVRVGIPLADLERRHLRVQRHPRGALRARAHGRRASGRALDVRFDAESPELHGDHVAHQRRAADAARLRARLHRAVAGVRDEGRLRRRRDAAGGLLAASVRAMGDAELAEDPRFATNALRVQHRAELVPRLEAIFRGRTVDDWIATLREAEVPAAPVNNLDRAFAEPPVAEREMIVEYDHPDVGRVRLPGNPIKMSGVRGTISNPAPRLGEHTDSVLRELLSLDADRIGALHACGAVK